MAEPDHPPAHLIRVLVTDVSDLFYSQIAELVHAEPDMLLVDRRNWRAAADTAARDLQPFAG